MIIHCDHHQHRHTVEVVSWPELSVVVTVLPVLLPPEVLLPPDVLLPPEVVLFEPPRPPADEVELLDPAPAPEVELLELDPDPAPKVELLPEGAAPAARVVVAVWLAPVATTTVSVPDAVV